VPSCQGPLDGRLALEQPVERVIELVAGGTDDVELGREGGGREATRGGQLRGRLQEACHDERGREVAAARGASVQEARQAQAPEHGQDRRDMTVGQAAYDPERRFERYQRLAPQRPLQGLDGRGRQPGE